MKKGIIRAIAAIQSIKQRLSEEAVNLLEKKREKTVNLFAQSVPTLSDEVDVSGKCSSSSGQWSRLNSVCAYRMYEATPRDDVHARVRAVQNPPCVQLQ